eukprot:comp17626_c0_seq1/m.17336 comp17626_c0_seq1/g.17336  ORF comp17626_c0_seq1/g.17336 comp17626_c0_seq1/m.17336 type:complete len:367 (-) comp17626_c0_seq1:472-1572(-)
MENPKISVTLTAVSNKKNYKMSERLKGIYTSASNSAQRNRVVAACVLLLLCISFVAHSNKWHTPRALLAGNTIHYDHGPTNTTEVNLESDADPSKIDEDDRLITLGLHKDTVEGWKVRRLIRNKQFKRQINMPMAMSRANFNWAGSRKEGNAYFQDNWEPTFSCPYERRLGHWGDGGKWICNPHRIKRPAIVYSLGSNNDFSFELAMHQHFAKQVELHTFDFGYPVGKPGFVNYHQYFISADDRNATLRNRVPHKTIKTIMQELGHEHIDIFKIDIEGSEMEVLLPLLERGMFPPVDQMQIELHMASHFKPSPEQVDRFFTLLYEQEQMEIFHKEPNTKFGGGIACEYSLVKVDWKSLLPEITRRR